MSDTGLLVGLSDRRIDDCFMRVARTAGQRPSPA